MGWRLLPEGKFIRKSDYLRVSFLSCLQEQGNAFRIPVQVAVFEAWLHDVFLL
jgi:hypothetical protein